MTAIVQTGCGSNPYDRAAEASAEVSEQKSGILEDYRKCLKNHPSDDKECSSYKDAADAM